MPNTTPRIWQQLGIGSDPAGMRLADAKHWGLLPAGITVAKPEPIFPRIEVREEPEVVESKPEKRPVAVPPQPPTTEIGIEDFAKMDLRVAKVLAAEKVEGTEKLLKLTVDLGNEQRTIVSGIAKHYAPDDLVGREIVMIVNLKPAKIRGIESRGMVLAASLDDKLALVTAEGMPPGSKVK